LEEINFDINEETYDALVKKKTQDGFFEKSWNDWLQNICGFQKKKKSIGSIIETTFQKIHFDEFYDLWIQNFLDNLELIWNGHSAKLLNPRISDDFSIVIGRGPSIKQFDHLDILKKSNFQGNVICTDGSLIQVLESGVTPAKFKNFFVVTIDSKDHIFEHYDDKIVDKFGDKIKGIISTTISPKVRDRMNDAGIKQYWLHTLFDFNKGKSSFNYISGQIVRSKNHHDGLPAIQTGGNVGTASWIISWSILKSKNVGLIGFDQGYSPDTPLENLGYGTHKFPTKLKNNKKLIEKAYPIIYNPEFKCKVRQDPIFQYYCNALKEFIPKASKFVKTFNATEGGALFGPGIECIRFDEFLLKSILK